MEFIALYLIAIPQETGRDSLFRKDLDDLLRSAGGCRAFGHINANEASASARQYNVYVQHAKGLIWIEQEIDRARLSNGRVKARIEQMDSCLGY